MFPDWISLILASSEIFHILTHLNVLFRFNPPSLEYLEKRGWYFSIDLITAALCCVYSGFTYWFLVLIHFIVHWWYVIQWNRGYYANRIKIWSTKEYAGPWFTVDFLLTTFDVMVHLLMAFSILSQG